MSLNYSNAQVAINTDESTADESAMLDVNSTTKGMLLPRMTTNQRIAISNAAVGLLVFDTDTKSFWLYTGAYWEEILAQATIQSRLDAGETPLDIYNSDNSLLDALYGKTYAGGLVFYFNTTDGSGMVAAPSDQSSGAQWGCVGTYLELSSPNTLIVGAGQQNTLDIIAGCEQAGIGARICDDLVLNGYDDWFLPSIQEQELMFEKLADTDGDGVNLGITDPNNIGGFTTDYYCGSSEGDDVGMWAEHFGTSNYGDSVPKNQNYPVRAVRAFEGSSNLNSNTSNRNSQLELEALVQQQQQEIRNLKQQLQSQRIDLEQRIQKLEALIKEK